jgi:hypothetical protein
VIVLRDRRAATSIARNCQRGSSLSSRKKNVDFARVALAPNGPAKLVYRGSSPTPPGKTHFYDAHFATAATIHLTVVFDAAGKIDGFSFE